MLAAVRSCTLVGIDAVPVGVEVDVAFGLPGYHVVGLAAQPVKEGAVRIQNALNNTEGAAAPLTIRATTSVGDIVARSL